MTDKKRRQRGSRTHGGGSHKNRRGAGHRGGRGRAGRDKHEFHNYEPLGKSGFDRPQKVQRDVETINLRTLDEDAVVLAAEGVAEETDDGYRVDARDVVEDGFEVDVVKVLDGGRVHSELEVVADDFSTDAAETLEAAGGAAVLSERGEELAAEAEAEADRDTTDEANEEA
ncbi:50S ribosomal protein L15 [Halobacteriales archaeon QS_4_69_225]|nr:MAG: 50S ribosomal protein L15 [Halobacteriales archaeon QS_4_69_225]